MKKYLSMIIFALALQGCSATVGEWQQGTKASGYRAHDVCFICGEQIKFIPNEPYAWSKFVEETDYYNNHKSVNVPW
jgi:PBP1b-binding outer membrane lipoprotein LpoB